MNCPLKSNILTLDKPVPRYTSYPPAPYFQIAKEGDKSTEQRLSKLKADKTLSLYLHVPFCPKLCWYCGCHTKITQRYAPVENYIHLLIREIGIIASSLKYKNKVTHIHFGGGSPGMVRSIDFDKIMARLKERFTLSPNVEISIELDPRNVTEGRIASYAKNGVNRVSLGIQDFDPTVLKAVNREQPFYLSYNAIKLLKEHGIEKVNFDLMYGLPHQTPQSMTETLKKALFLNPSRIAFFGYAHVPWMKKHMRLINSETLPDNSQRYDLFETGQSIIQQAGYQQIGIDHFAHSEDNLHKALKNKTLKRNFQGYTTDDADILIGLGASSIGKIERTYIQNAADMPSYKNSILAGKIPTKKYLDLTPDDILRSEIIEDIMCYGEVDIGSLCQKHGFQIDYMDSEIQQLTDYIEKDLAVLHKRNILIKKSPHFVMRLISNIFDSHRSSIQHQHKHAKAV